MASRTQLQQQIDEMQETLEQVSDLAEEGLDAELTREELVAKVKEIADAVSTDEEEEDQGEDAEKSGE
jgi:TolA-binding protein